IVVDDRVIANSKPTESAGMVDISFDASFFPSDVPNPAGKVGELQVIDADGYLLVGQPFTIQIPSGPGCS
ncbi:MAG: hypothetical protein ABMA25_21450, partial [Ilumatobacteraceae bacterium]